MIFTWFCSDFEPSTEEGDITEDYRLHEGVSQSQNIHVKQIQKDYFHWLRRLNDSKLPKSVFYPDIY